jgi:hypothetical protein
MISAARRTIMTGAAFALAAGTTRVALQHGIDTRFQILAYAVMFVMFELAVRQSVFRQRTNLFGLFIGLWLIVLAVCLVRWWLEGLCPGSGAPRCLPITARA